jgi:hypothetical protein
MTEQTPTLAFDTGFVRRAREFETMSVMVRMYCRGHGHANRAPLCTDCTDLLAYATRRLQRCIFGDDKPACAGCVVHCYRAAMRTRVRAVMRWAGPRMLLRHPILAVAHMIAERRQLPPLPDRVLKSNRYRGGPRADR